jgi:hypothetical protein
LGRRCPIRADWRGGCPPSSPSSPRP